MMVEDLEKIVAENSRQISEVWALFNRFGEQREEEAKARAKEREEAKEREKKLDEQMAQTDEKLKHLTKENEKTTKSVNKLSKDIASITDRWGMFVESIVKPGMFEAFAKIGIHLTSVSSRIKRTQPVAMEIDLLYTNGDYVLLVEAKSNLTQTAVNQHLKHLKHFKEAFPEYRDKKVLGAVAAIDIPSDIEQHAKKKRLYVVTPSHNHVKILNEAGFKAQEW